MAAMKLGMVGAGFVAKFHARALAQVRNIELAGVTALAGAEELAKSAKQEGLGDTKVYKDVKEMAKNVDAVAIFIPNFARLETMEQIAEAAKEGAKLKGVICEKPLARNMKEARRMVELADGAGLKTAYFENQIFMPTVRNAMDQLAPQQKAMGPIHLTRSNEEHGGPHEPWFWDPTRQGGGVLCDMGCHSIAVGWYVLTPIGKPVTFLEPQTVTATTLLLKWGKEDWRAKLMERGVDYSKTPAEDFATAIITFKNPDTGQIVMGQVTDSWMYDAPGLRLLMEGYGAGYSFVVNSLESPSHIFIADVAAEAVADAELALEKAQASRGLLTLQANEADLYGYVAENADAATAFMAGKDAYLPWSYGLEITKLIMAGYMSAERGTTLDLTDAAVQKELETYVPLIQQGKGGEILQVL